MIVHIAPIGESTGHVLEWIREVTPVTKIYLIHSKKSKETNFPKKARELEKDIHKIRPSAKVIMKVIENSFNIDDTYDAINEIINEEREENNIENYEIAINVSGGTNVMAAAAILAATMKCTKAYYVLDERKNPGQDNYVVELPIPLINTGKMNETQQEVLRLISEGTFERIDIIEKISPVSLDDKWKPKGKTISEKRQYDFCTCGHWEEKHPKKSTHRIRAIRECEEPKCRCKKFEVKITGTITKKKLLEKMGLDKSVPYNVYDENKKPIGQRKIQKGATKIHAIATKLESKGYITISKKIPTLKKRSLGGDRFEFKKGNTSGVLYKITTAGRRQAKDMMMASWHLKKQAKT